MLHFGREIVWTSILSTLSFTSGVFFWIRTSFSFLNLNSLSGLTESQRVGTITSKQLADEGFRSILGRRHMGPGRFFSDSLALSLSPVRQSTWEVQGGHGSLYCFLLCLNFLWMTSVKKSYIWTWGEAEIALKFCSVADSMKNLHKGIQSVQVTYLCLQKTGSSSITVCAG